MSSLAVSFDDMTVLSEDGIDVFVLNLNEGPEPPPYYVDVDGRRFHFSGETFLVFGHSAVLPRYVREHEEQDELVLVVERDGRYMPYLFDPHEDDDEDDEAGTEDGD